MEHVWEDILTQQISNSTLEDAVKKSPRKWVYLFSEGNADMRTLLGGKGAGVAEMTNAGLPVPPGFTITTEACIAYYEAGKRFPQGMWEQVLAALKIVEQQTGKGFGDKDNPLLVSVRSGAKFSMPGMMDTVLNLGINDETVQGLVKLTGDERFAYDAYRRFIQMFSKIVLNTDPADWDVTKVARIWDTHLTKYPDIKAAFFHNDDMALAAANVMKARGKTGIIIGGVDAMPPALEAVMDGRMLATVRNPSCRIHGWAVAAGVAAVVSGEKTGKGIPKNIVTDGPVITKETAPGIAWMERHFLI